MVDFAETIIKMAKLSPKTNASKYPCPCCGYLSFHDRPGSYEICEICYWMDDAPSLRYATIPIAGNEVSLVQAQDNYRSFGASTLSMHRHVRDVTPDDVRDPKWRPFDTQTDLIELPSSDVALWPDDLTNLYYWKNTNEGVSS